MARNKFSSPTLTAVITDEQWEKAVRSKSGGCLIADSIKSQYPQYTGVTVDMATIRFSDRALGVRYTYLTPGDAQHLLIGYDAGWPKIIDEVHLRKAVKVTPITRPKQETLDREGRLAELEEKAASGEELTRYEKSSLTTLRNSASRPSARGPSEVKVDENRGTVVHGGAPAKQGKAHPNLLRGSDRHFGAKLANPGLVFEQAVEAAVAERLKQTTEETKS